MRNALLSFLNEEREREKKWESAFAVDIVIPLALCLFQWIISFGLLAIKRLEVISMHQ